jgi:hypothetical protein
VCDNPGHEDADIVLTIRASRVFLKAPEHDDHSPVPDDFIVAIGVCRAFYDPQFRRVMMLLARKSIDSGEVDGIVSNYGHDRPH